jgi:hypothetical protein
MFVRFEKELPSPWQVFLTRVLTEQLLAYSIYMQVTIFQKLYKYSKT